MTQLALNNGCHGVVATFQFCCTVAASTLAPHTGKCCMQDDATEAEWYDVTKLPSLAFDHKLIVRTAFQHLLKQPEATSTGTGVCLRLCQHTSAAYCRLTYTSTLCMPQLGCQELQCTYLTHRSLHRKPHKAIFIFLVLIVSQQPFVMICGKNNSCCVLAADGLAGSLQKGAQNLESPWTPPKE